MTTPLEHFQKAKFKYDAAFHLLKVTFPLVNDPRLLIGVIGNLSESSEAIINALLEYERTNERPSRNLLDFVSKFNLFRNKIVPQYHLPHEMIGVITQMRQILNFHAKSSIEFQRGGKMVLCKTDYREMELISLKDVERFREQTRQMLQITAEILNRKT